jgi:transketolase
MQLSERGKQIRRDTIELSLANGGYHYGGSFSCVEILIALYDEAMQNSDDFILSKGHGCWPWYVLLREKGLDPKLEGHPSRDPHNGMLCSTGSLGHGLPTAIGIALARKQTGEHGTVFVLMGDGECQEGTTWESMLIAGHWGLDNLVVIVDWNGIQGSGFVKEILPISGLGTVAEVLGWHVVPVDGHEIEKIVHEFKNNRPEEMPKMILAATVKGKGVSFMEGNPSWHARWLGGDHLTKAMEELE